MNSLDSGLKKLKEGWVWQNVSFAYLLPREILALNTVGRAYPQYVELDTVKALVSLGISQKMWVAFVPENKYINQKLKENTYGWR